MSVMQWIILTYVPIILILSLNHLPKPSTIQSGLIKCFICVMTATIFRQVYPWNGQIETIYIACISMIGLLGMADIVAAKVAIESNKTDPHP